MKKINLATLFFFLFLLFVNPMHSLQSQETAEVTLDNYTITVSGGTGVTYLLLRIQGPDGNMICDLSSNGSPLDWYVEQGMMDGLYSYEVRQGFVPKRSKEERKTITGKTRQLPPRITSGKFLIQSGGIVMPTEEETGFIGRLNSYMKVAGTFVGDFLVSPAYADVLHYDDVIITGSECVGFDCTNGMSFGYDTTVLKENNLRIFIDDTSSTSSFPRNDWRMIFNDTTNGGASYFSVQDATASRRIFTLEAGAPANSLYVEDYGRVGLGTSVPYTELHIADGDTPTVRLDQDGSSGWAAQVWDMAGNETNFFIRDVTNGSKLSFRIQPGTPSNTLALRNSGNVGIGTWSPTNALHVQRTDGTAKILVEETSSTLAGRTLLELINYGNTKLAITNSNAGNTWSLINSGSDIRFSLLDSGLTEMIVDNNGNLEVVGTSTATNHINTSSREVKHGFQEVAQKKILEQLTQLPISSWQYNEGDNGNRHIGPVAEDFQEIFGLGDGKHISTVDTDGIALAAIQGLKIEKDQELAQRDQQIQLLQAELAKLRDLMQTLITPNTVAIRD